MRQNTIRIGLTLLALSAGTIAFTWWFYNQVGTPQVNLPTFGSMGTANTQSRILEEDDIAEVVFRDQFKQCFPDKERQVYFLFRKAKEDPSNKFMKRFQENTPPVKKFSQSRKHSDGISDKDSGRRGILLGVGKIQWVDDSKVEVIGSCFADAENLMEFVYDVIREGNQWVVKGSKITLMT